MTWAEMPRPPGHVFHDRLQELLSEAGFDAFVEVTCKPFYAPKMGAPSKTRSRFPYEVHEKVFVLSFVAILPEAPAMSKQGEPCERGKGCYARTVRRRL